MTDHPAVAVVVPSLDGRVALVLASIARQTLRPAEVEVVVGVGPNGRARNLGVARTTAPLIVFVDDDAVLGGDDTLANLVAPLHDDPTIGVAGAAKLLPPGAARFQQAVARQVPRVEHPVVDRLVDSNPPIDRLGYSEVTTTCCAIPRRVLEGCGGFDEGLVRGVDSELFVRLRRAGYRLVLVPRTWAYHPAPANLRALLAKHFWYGVGFAQHVRRDPSQARGLRRLRTPAHAAAYLLARTAWVLPHAVVGWSGSDPRVRPGFRPFRALSSYAAAVGYVYGWYRTTAFPPRRPVTPLRD